MCLGALLVILATYCNLNNCLDQISLVFVCMEWGIMWMAIHLGLCIKLPNTRKDCFVDKNLRRLSQCPWFLFSFHPNPKLCAANSTFCRFLCCSFFFFCVFSSSSLDSPRKSVANFQVTVSLVHKLKADVYNKKNTYNIYLLD